MTRNIRKIVSIICAVALLLSLSVVSLTGSSSAAIPAGDEVVAKWEKVKEYNFDNSSGIAYKRFIDHTSFANGALWVANSGGGGGVWFAEDPACATVIDHGSANSDQKATAYTNMLKLEPNTTYKVTYKYKYLAGSNTLALGLLFSTNATSVAPIGLGQAGCCATTVQNTSSELKLPEGQTALAADTEWYSDTVIFTTGNNSCNIGIRPNYANGTGKINRAHIDDFVIEKQVGAEYPDVDNKYVFDYKDGDAAINALDIIRNIVSDRTQQHYTLCNVNGKDNDKCAQSFVDAKGLHFNFCSSNPFTPNQYTWNNNAFVYDTDAVEGGMLCFKTNTSYIVTVKYKVTDMGGNKEVGIGIAANQKDKLGFATYKLATAMHTEVSADWQYLTAAFSTADNATLVNDYLYLVARASAGKGAGLLVESVTVQERRNADAGVAIVVCEDGADKTATFATPGVAMALSTPENSDPDKGFAGWFSGDTKVDMNNFVPVNGINTLTAKWVSTAVNVTFNNCGTVTTECLAVGMELPRAARPDPRFFFGGWYTDVNFTDKVTVVPDQDVTLYAKYNGTYLEMNNKGYVDTTSPSISIVQDPDDATNNVLKVVSRKGGRHNFSVPAYDDSKASYFELKPGTTYQYSYRYKVAPGSDAGDIYLFYGDQASGANSTRTAISGQVVCFEENKTDSSSAWITVTGSFTTPASLYLERVKWSYQNHMYFTQYNSKTDKATEVYYDDIVVVEAVTEAPEGATTIHFETNGPVISDMYGYPGEAITMPEDPVTGSGKFLGWYTDKKLTVPFTDKVFGTENVTLYAKWESTQFVVDFSDYNTTNMLSRCKLINVGGNDMLDYKSEHSPTITNYGSLYRAHLNKAGVTYQVEEGLQYTISFKYKLSRGTLKYGAVTNARYDSWVNYTVQTGGGTLTKVSDDWTEVSFVVTIKNDSGSLTNWNYLSLGLGGDADALIDDVEVIAKVSTMNLYGSTIVYFNTGDGNAVNPISGEPGEALGTLPVPTRAGYMFDGWYTDAELTTKFTGKTFGEDSMTLYASWIIGKFNESYEDIPNSVISTGVGGGYKVYTSATFTDFDKANVQHGNASVFRSGATTGTKAFTLCRDAKLALTKGKQYTLTFYVKPTNVTDAAGTINLITMKNNTTAINTPTSTMAITTVGALKSGEWQMVSYTFTADDEYVGISTTAGNDMYLDNFTVTLKGYTGTTTGDSSVSPIFVIMLVVLAAGSLIVTGKKVFEN